ncbi:MAG TPA: ABC transporter substrate-binding protein [Candidatus Binatia bacterium]|nr:ABC transporter substrate-binding protein [Candidatus Binatia bacterium]
MRSRWIAALGIAAALACAQPSRAQTIHLSYSGNSGQNIPFWVTYDSGMFKKYGLSTDLVLISGGLTNIQAVMANEIRFSYLGAASPIQAAVQGADIMILATVYGLMPYGLITGSGVRTAADLKGKRAAVSRIGGIEEVAIRAAIEKLGLGPKDVTFIQAGPDALRIAAVESGSVAAAAVAPPALFSASARGLNVIADLGALGIKYPTSVIAARRATVAQDRPMAKKFLMGLIEGIHIYKQRKDYAMQVTAKYTKQNDPQILAQTYDYFAKNVPSMPFTDPSVIEAGLAATEKPGAKNAKDLYDNSLLQELEQEGFSKKLGK